MRIVLLQRVAAGALVVTLILPLPSFGWGNEGHRLVNRLAAASLPADIPVFMRSELAINEIEYLGPEPDRTRRRLRPLPRNRQDFEATAFAHNQRPEKVGLQPWQTFEIWQRLKAALREYRHLSAASPINEKDLRGAEQAVIFYAGWLGHYVGNGSQPLHTTINYDGWALKDNPKNFSTAHGIHWRFEGTFVGANISDIAAGAQKKMAPLAPVDGDIFDSYVAYLRHSATMIDTVYAFDKAGAFAKSGTAESRDFTASRIAAGASELRDLIYAAWRESARPVADRY